MRIAIVPISILLLFVCSPCESDEAVVLIRKQAYKLENTPYKDDVTFFWPVEGAMIECSIPCGECSSLEVQLLYNIEGVYVASLRFDDTEVENGFIVAEGAISHNVVLDISGVSLGKHSLSITIVNTSGAVIVHNRTVAFEIVPIHLSDDRFRATFVTFVTSRNRVSHREIAAEAAKNGYFNAVKVIRPNDIDLSAIDEGLNIQHEQIKSESDETRPICNPNSEAWSALAVSSALQDVKTGHGLLFLASSARLRISSPTRALFRRMKPEDFKSVAVFREMNGTKVTSDVFAVKKSQFSVEFVKEWVKEALRHGDDGLSALGRVAARYDVNILRHPAERASSSPSDDFPQFLAHSAPHPSKEQEILESHDSDRFEWSPYCWMERHPPLAG